VQSRSAARTGRADRSTFSAGRHVGRERCVRHRRERRGQAGTARLAQCSRRRPALALAAQSAVARALRPGKAPPQHHGAGRRDHLRVDPPGRRRAGWCVAAIVVRERRTVRRPSKIDCLQAAQGATKVWIIRT
jgi:hypothetical protein